MNKSFIDTNIWVYALIEADEERDKKAIIVSFLEELKKRSAVVASVQVLNEFHWVLRRKYGIDESIIRKKVMNGILELARITPLDLKIYKNAYDIRDDYSISYWDSIIVATALESECDYLFSEDMTHRQIIKSKLKILNPLLCTPEELMKVKEASR